MYDASLSEIIWFYTVGRKVFQTDSLMADSFTTFKATTVENSRVVFSGFIINDPYTVGVQPFITIGGGVSLTFTDLETAKRKNHAK